MDTLSNFIGGRYVPFDPDATYPIVSPVDGAFTARVHEADEALVDEAVMAAHRALTGPWRDLTQPQRSDLLNAVAAGISERFDDFVEAEMADTGQPRHVMEKAFVYGIALLSKWIGQDRFPQGIYSWPPKLPEDMKPTVAAVHDCDDDV